MDGIMYKKFIVLILTIFVGLTAAEECKAQYDTLKFGEFGVSSVSPISSTSVKGKVWVDVENPLGGFTVSNIEAAFIRTECLWSRDVPMIIMFLMESAV